MTKTSKNPGPKWAVVQMYGFVGKKWCRPKTYMRENIYKSVFACFILMTTRRRYDNRKFIRAVFGVSITSSKHFFDQYSCRHPERTNFLNVGICGPNCSRVDNNSCSICVHHLNKGIKFCVHILKSNIEMVIEILKYISSV